MSFKSKKVLVMCCEGLYQDHLINRLNQSFSVCGIVRHRSKENNPALIKRIIKHKNPLSFIKHVVTRLKLRKYESIAAPVIKQLFSADNLASEGRSEIAQIYSDDINKPEVVSFIKTQKPDLICVNGTNLLRQPILDIIDTIEFGIINLHTGLSPYSRGGNCNLYMLLARKPELVGITVHHIDKGIDSGDIIISNRLAFEPKDNYEIIDAKCFHMGIEAMIHACEQLFKGHSVRIKQWQQGQLFLKRTGYYYHPAQRLEVNKLIEQGLLKRYLDNPQNVDETIRTVGEFKYADENTT